jgi:hypothetical protein
MNSTAKSQRRAGVGPAIARFENQRGRHRCNRWGTRITRENFQRWDQKIKSEVAEGGIAPCNQPATVGSSSETFKCCTVQHLAVVLTVNTYSDFSLLTVHVDSEMLVSNVELFNI